MDIGSLTKSKIEKMKPTEAVEAARALANSIGTLNGLLAVANQRAYHRIGHCVLVYKDDMNAWELRTNIEGGPVPKLPQKPAAIYLDQNMIVQLQAACEEILTLQAGGSAGESAKSK